MYLILLIFPFVSYYLYHNKIEIIMNIIKLYECCNRRYLRHIQHILSSKGEISEIFMNYKPSNINDVLKCKPDDCIEILWRGRYSAIYMGAYVDYDCPFESCSEKKNILYATLHKNGTTEDVTEYIERYSGPNGDFFKHNRRIFNHPSKFMYKSSNGKYGLMLETHDDYITVMNNTGDEMELRL